MYSCTHILILLVCGLFVSCAGEEDENLILLPSSDKLTASDYEVGDQFGYSVSTSGGFAIIGALYNDDDGESSGSAYIFDLETLTQVQKLVASDGAEGDRFGAERDGVAISGNYAIVGAYKDDSDAYAVSGSAYIFERNTTDGVWTQIQKITAGTDAFTDRRFGTCVDIDGDYAIVGAPANAAGGSFGARAYIFKRRSDGLWLRADILTVTDITGTEKFATTVSISGDYAIVGAQNDNNGSAFIFERSNDDVSWNLAAKLLASDGASGDSFGASVSIYNDLVIVGAPSTNNGGSAYIFERQSDGTWIEMDILIASDGVSGDLFGQDVSINDNYAIVGATSDYVFYDDIKSGSIYIFKRNCSGSWVEMTKLLATNPVADGNFGFSISMSEDNEIVIGEYGNEAVYFYEIAEEVNATFLPSSDKLSASDYEVGDQFGYSVSASGGYAIIGALYNDDEAESSGSAYIFELDERRGGAQEVQKLVASDGEEDDRFGAERDGVAISGNYAIIGAYKDDDSGENSGSAYIFERSSDDDGVWIEKQKLFASDADRDRRYGTCVDIDGDYAIVGAPANSAGGSFEAGAYIYERSSSDGEWSETAILRVENITGSERFATTVSISGNYAIVGAEYDDTGSAFIFERSDGSWNLTAKLVASDGASGDSFGRSVSIYNDLAIIGAYLSDNGGSAYIFERQSDGTWTEMDKLVANDGVSGDDFGQDVSINDNYAIVGASTDYYGSIKSGSTYIFQRCSASWVEMSKLLPSNATQDGRFGHSISISEDNEIVIGEYGNEAAYFANIYVSEMPTSMPTSMPSISPTMPSIVPETPSTSQENEDEGSRECVSFGLLFVLWLQYVM